MAAEQGQSRALARACGLSSRRQVQQQAAPQQPAANPAAATGGRAGPPPPSQGAGPPALQGGHAAAPAGACAAAAAVEDLRGGTLQPGQRGARDCGFRFRISAVLPSPRPAEPLAASGAAVAAGRQPTVTSSPVWFNLHQTELDGKLDWRSKVNSPPVEAAFEQFTRHLITEWVTDLWYSRVTPDKEGPEELITIVQYVSICSCQASGPTTCSLPSLQPLADGGKAKWKHEKEAHS